MFMNWLREVWILKEWQVKVNSILETIGRTPLVRLNKIAQHLACEVYVKCELFNPGGSIKDRIAFQMVEQAEKEGRIQPGDTLIEATSGNTGIGLAMVGAVKGYSVIIVMPEKMSQEKQVVIEALGATIVRTPTEAAFDDPDSHIEVAKRLRDDTPRAHILDQYSNDNNTNAHFEYTGQEILDDLDGQVDMVVMGVGTGGTITGVAKKIKAHNPGVSVVGVDPEGSILGGGDEVSSYLVEGIGYDFFPEVLDNNLVNQYIKTNDKNSLNMARRLIKEEGLLVGGSSGAAVWAGLKAAESLKEGQRCVIVLPDSIRNYLSKFADTAWMKQNDLMEVSS